MFKRLFSRNPYESTARALYQEAVRQARREPFYRGLGVPDTLDGRFEMICLHVYLLLLRLRGTSEESDRLTQALFDALFADMDQSLREMGAGDLGVGPRVKKMGQGFYGRIAAYDAALTGEGESLSEALRRNVYGTLPEVAEELPETLGAYLRSEQRDLAAQPEADLLQGRVRFGPPPGAPERAALAKAQAEQDAAPAEREH